MTHFRNVREVDGSLERRCPQCDTWKPQTAEHYYFCQSNVKRNKKYPWHSICRECAKLRVRKYRHDNPESRAEAERRASASAGAARQRAFELFSQIEGFLVSIPTAPSIVDLLPKARKLRPLVTLYLEKERKPMERRLANLRAKNGQ